MEASFATDAALPGCQALTALLAPLARGGVAVGWRRIVAGDERALTPDEATGFRHADRATRRQSGAARIAARTLLQQIGVGEASIRRDARRAPLWPSGVVGSLAHEAQIAVAAVGRAGPLRSIGIDIEAAGPLPDDVAARVATPAEARYGACRTQLFVVKEAVFKAAHPVDGVFLDFADIDVDLAAGVAHVRYGRRVPFDVVSGSHIAALARLEA